MPISIFIPILALLGFGAIFAKLSRTSFYISLPAILSTLVTSLYFAEMLGFLRIFCFATYFFGISCFAAYFYFEKDLQHIISKYKSEIALLFFICIVNAIFVNNAHFASWDDFSHWGIFSKELIYRNSLERFDDITSVTPGFSNYPRAPAIFHYYFQAINGTSFSEPTALFSHFLLHIILLLPLAGNSKPWQTASLMFPILMISTFYTTGLRSIYNDSTISLMFSSIFAIYIMEKDKTKALLLVIPTLILMPLFREIGFWLGIFGASIISILHANYMQIRISKITKYHLLYLTLIFLPIISSEILTYYYQSTHDFWGKRAHRNVFDIILNYGVNEFKITIIYFREFIKLATFEGSLVVFLFIFAAFYWTKKYNQKAMKDLKLMLLVLSLFFVIFILFRLYLYLSVYSLVEAFQVKSLKRYIGTYFMSYAVVSSCFIKLSYFEKEVAQNKFEKISIYLMLIVSISTVIVAVKRLPTSYSKNEAIQQIQLSKIYGFLKEAQNIEMDFANKYDDMDCYKIKYKLAPYFSQNFTKKCLNAPDNIDAKLRMNEVEPEQQSFEEAPKNCTIFYQPFLLKLKLICK